MLPGCRSVAERALHDFFYNVRRLVGSIARVKLFGLFVGVEDMDRDAEGLSHLQVAHRLFQRQLHRYVHLLIVDITPYDRPLRAVTIVAGIRPTLWRVLTTHGCVLFNVVSDGRGGGLLPAWRDAHPHLPGPAARLHHAPPQRPAGLAPGGTQATCLKPEDNYIKI